MKISLTYSFIKTPENTIITNRTNIAAVIPPKPIIPSDVCNRIIPTLFTETPSNKDNRVS